MIAVGYRENGQIDPFNWQEEGAIRRWFMDELTGAAGPDRPAPPPRPRDTLVRAAGWDSAVATGVRVSPRYLFLVTSRPTRHLRCASQAESEGARFLFERS